jgi:hypothetical protein
MADHLDAPGLTSPGNDARLDITDIYAFQKPGDASKSILILNVNPLAPTLADTFRHDAIYELKVDTNGDAIADRAFRFLFSEVEDGKQVAEVRLATGADAADANDSGDQIIEDARVSFGSTPRVTEQGPYKFFAGIRSDPFFFDLNGFLAGLKFTGSDFFADKNVFGIVLEVPNTALGDNPQIGIWGRTSVPRNENRGNNNDDSLPIDRMGRPAINTVFNKGDDKNVFNEIEPTQDRDLFLAKFVAVLKSLSSPQYSNDQATGIARVLLPDILTYDFSSSAGFLNGRNLKDPVIAIALTLVTNGAVTTDKVKGPHTDLLSSFPFMGNPH